MMQILVIGGGGHGQVVMDILNCMRDAGEDIYPIGYLDDNPDLKGKCIDRLPVLGTTHQLSEFAHDAVIVAIGDNRLRRSLFDEFTSQGENFVKAIHPGAMIARGVTVGPGSVICAGVVINSGSRIGSDVIINTGATVDHHNCIGDHVHVAPGAHTGGEVMVAEGTLLGIGSTVIPGRRIGSWVTVGAGAVVTRDVVDRVTVVGVPAMPVLREEQKAAIPSASEDNGQRISMSSPDLTKAEMEAVLQVLDTPVLSIGPRIDSFEKQVASRCGAAYATAVNSGTSGLHLAILAADVKENDLVITTPFSFIASANCILYERGIPVFVDVDPASGNIDPRLVEQAATDITTRHDYLKWLPPVLRRSARRIGRLRALLPVHAFGQPADMEPLLTIAERFNLPVIEDACEAIGAQYKGRSVGSLGDAGVLAFYPNKQITTGEGGVIVTNRTDWDALFRSLRNQGRDVFDSWLNHTRLGFNYRMDEMSAALGLAQIARLDELLAKRQQVADWYNERLVDCPHIQIPAVCQTTTRMSWFVYVIRVLPPASRNSVMTELKHRGIPSRPYFTPIHLQPFYRQRFEYKLGDFPVTEYLGDVSLALPFSGVLTEEEVDIVCKELLNILNQEDRQTKVQRDQKRWRERKTKYAAASQA